MEEAWITEGVTADFARERDRALRRLQVLAAEIRVHEDAMRGQIASPLRPADERLYRRLRQVNDGRRDHGEGAVACRLGLLERAGGLSMSLVIYRCPSCAKSSFAFPRPAEVARCGSCGEPLNRRRDAAAAETEIRQRLLRSAFRSREAAPFRAELILGRG